MDRGDLDRLLSEFLVDDVPPTVATEAGSLFDRRTPTDELADVVEVVEVSVGVDDVDVDRTITFAGAGQVVTVAVAAAGRRAVGRVHPPRSAAITLVDVNGTTSASRADDRGVFELVAVPAARVQIIVSAEGSEHARTLRTAWTALIAGSSGSQVRLQADGAAGDELVVRRLAARATTALARYQAGLVDGLLDGQRPIGRLDPPGPAVSRVLAPAAQHGARQRPRHRWTSEDERLEIVLDESIEGRLTLTVLGAVDLSDDLVVSVGWSTTDTDGSTTDHQLATPLPAESLDRRAATYDVGSALDLRAFGLGAVRVSSAHTVTAATVEASLRHRPYGNAVRAWHELLGQHPDAAMREAFERSLRAP